MTVTSFILTGTELRARVEFQGPVAQADVANALDLNEAIVAFEKGRHQYVEEANILFEEDLDFEHLSLKEETFEEDDLVIDDDDMVDDDKLSSQDRKEALEKRKARRAQQRKKALEARHRAEQNMHRQKKKIREEGKPFQKTFRAPVAGWYRFCVRATWYQVVAEIDIRKESELGGVDESGHVWSFEQRAIAEEDKMMQEDTATEEGIKDEDFEVTKEKLRTLRRLLATISARQQEERRRLVVHGVLNEKSHSQMVMGSLFETILFMVITGAQIMTIRRWFKGAPVLGR